MRALMAVWAVGALLAVAAPGAMAASCPRDLGLRVRTPTSNAAALQRVGMLRVDVLAGAPVRDMRVELARGGRVIATGSRTRVASASSTVRLAFRHTLKPGRVSVVVSGRRAGCRARRQVRRTLSLDGRDLPVGVVATDRGDGHVELALRRRGGRPAFDAHARLLDATGHAVGTASKAGPLGRQARLVVRVASAAPGGRYVLVLTARMRGLTRRSTVARTLELDADPPPAGGGVPGDPPPAAVGAVVQRVAVSWSGGRWQGADSAGFSIPGIGDGQVVCRPDTQWVRVFPSDRSREVAMTLWTFRDWEGASESALREAQMTAFTGPDFNEGLNKFQPAEKRSHGSFTGVVGDGLAAAGTFGAGRAPTELRVSWSWDFEDPAAARCSVVATLTSQGPGSAGVVARGLSLGWRGESAVAADTTISTPVPGLGTLRLRCDPRPEGVRQLVLEPDVALAGLTTTTYEGSEGSGRVLGEAPYVVALPNNGLVEAATPRGSAVRIVVASRWKVNDPDPAQNFCRLSGIVVSG